MELPASSLRPSSAEFPATAVAATHRVATTQADKVRLVCGAKRKFAAREACRYGHKRGDEQQVHEVGRDAELAEGLDGEDLKAEQNDVE